MAEDAGRVPMALFLKVHAEAYLFADPDYSGPRERWQLFLRLHEAMRWEAREAGLDTVTIWVPPELAEKTAAGQEAPFVRRLKKLGWNEDVWRAFSYRVR